MALLRVTRNSGDDIDDPDEAGLLQLFLELERDPEGFITIERLSDPSGLTYAQAAPFEDGAYVVEHQDGNLDRHFTATVANMQQAYDVVSGWAFHRPNWDAGIAWSKQ